MKVTVDILDEKNWLISITRWENYGLNYVGSWYPGCWLTLVTGMNIFPARSTALGAGPIKRATHLIFQTVPYTGLLTAISISSWCTLYNIHGHIYKAVTPASIVSKFSILHTQVYTFTNTINKDKIQSRDEELCFYFGHIVSLAIQWYSPADMHHWTANSSCPQNEAAVYIASYRTDHK